MTLTELGCINGLPELTPGVNIVSGETSWTAFNFAATTYVMKAMFKRQSVCVHSDGDRKCNDAIDRYVAMAYDKITNTGRKDPLTKEEIAVIRKSMIKDNVTRPVQGNSLFVPDCYIDIYIPSSKQRAANLYTELVPEHESYVQKGQVQILCLPKDIINDTVRHPNPVINYHGTYVEVGGRLINLKYHGNGILTSA